LVQPASQFATPSARQARMYKLITILAAAIPIVLFLRTIIFGKSKVLREATSEFRRQIDYLVWGFVFLIGCALVYSVGTLIHSMWK
jgi:multisubunit Na+/H+ antiporter MnhB subunit